MAFMRLKNTAYTSVVPTLESPWQVMFLRGGRVAKISQDGLTTEGPLTGSYGSRLANVPEPYASSSDGAMYVLPADDSYPVVFFNGDNCLHWRGDQGHQGQGVVYTGPVTGLPVFGRWLTADYQKNVDATLPMPYNGGTWRNILFKGLRATIIDWSSGVQYEGPVNGLPEAGWKKMPDGFQGDYDHAVPLPSDGSVPRTLFVKGDRGMLFHWNNGPEKTGTLASLLPGLAALPSAYATPYRPNTGRYTGTSGTTQLELRIDVDGPQSQYMISGDLFNVAGGTTTYVNSFKVPAPVITPSTDTVTVSGDMVDANASGSYRANAVITRATSGNPSAACTITNADGSGRLQFACTYASPFLRTVDWEVDTMAGTVLFNQYDTGSNPRPYGVPARTLTIPGAYAEAGVELRVSANTNQVPVATAGADLRWSEAELHAAMVGNFSGHREAAQWKLWSFVATRFAEDGVLGIMFDQAGLQRQGMAVFYTEQVAGGRAGTRRELRTYVHEIGHAFNLLHSWDKPFANPPQPLGPRNGFGDLSWMNYDWKYQGPVNSGDAAYWAEFGYRFTDNELKHLRHGFYRSVIMGGSNFITGAADAALEKLTEPVADGSGLCLRLTGKSAFAYGEPVVAEFKLALDGSRPEVEVYPDLSPKSDHLTIGVTDPSGTTRIWRPMSHICTNGDRRLTLTSGNPAVYSSVYLGFGADGLTFTQPGVYRIKAAYVAPDGARVVSPAQTIRVRSPLDRADESVAELLMDDQQGTLLAVLGSDAPELQRGNDALDELLARYGDHPLAVYARMVKGTNAGRHFLTYDPAGISVRPADTKESIEQLNAVVEASVADTGTDTGVDNITLNETMQRLARAHAREGDMAQADAVLDQLVETFRDKDVPAPVLETIQQQAETARTSIHEES